MEKKNTFTPEKKQETIESIINFIAQEFKEDIEGFKTLNTIGLLMRSVLYDAIKIVNERFTDKNNGLIVEDEISLTKEVKTNRKQEDGKVGNLVKINNQDLQVKEFNDQRMVTFKDIDMLHERVEGTASRNFSENRKHFVERQDYFKVKLTENEIRSQFGASKNASELTLITEGGYLMLVKSLTDDLAWKVQRELVNNYFRVKENNILINQLSPELQMFNKLFNALAEQELTNKQIAAEVKETKQEVQSIRDVIALNPNSWRSEVSNLLNKMAIQRGGTQEAYKEVRDESYKLLNERAGAKLETRLTNRRRKVLEETGSKSKADKVSKLDVIADDKRLTEVYIAIVKEMAIKYKVA